ncbi:MerR family transcriptional regulator [Sagittula sp. MA-2]|jgi:DNA-binding transcriptional MerR regulator|uniref:MerR family transcriptional regulator n=1 Tax=Sagittula sp. MA-2 TaxID=3048007 RepID=UPI0024C368E8|nr:MerR family transcriptional regulator [Sagittula sp. MA-2]WHZ37546.1 MerR family transcriptional regulator [Sagittula sp. MA-2]
MSKSPDAFRTISEVSEWLETPAHVLRFWESKFTQVKPVKRAGGRRYYRPADMELLGGIKKLLHEDGLTIKGVQKVLREQGVRYVSGLSPQVGDDDTDAELIEDAPYAEVEQTDDGIVAFPGRTADPQQEAPQAAVQDTPEPAPVEPDQMAAMPPEDEPEVGESDDDLPSLPPLAPFETSDDTLAPPAPEPAPAAEDSSVSLAPQPAPLPSAAPLPSDAAGEHTEMTATNAGESVTEDDDMARPAEDTLQTAFAFDLPQDAGIPSPDDMATGTEPDLTTPDEDPFDTAPEAADVMEDVTDSDVTEAEADADFAAPDTDTDTDTDAAPVPDIAVPEAPARAANALNLPDFGQPEDAGPPTAGPGLLARAAALRSLSPEQAQAIAAQMPALQQRLDRLNGAAPDDA